jgi:hypothetical protein
MKEILDHRLGADRLSIDPNAMIIDDEDRRVEARLLGGISSTRQGVGSAAARKILGRGIEPRAFGFVGALPPAAAQALQLLVAGEAGDVVGARGRDVGIGERRRGIERRGDGDEQVPATLVDRALVVAALRQRSPVQRLDLDLKPALRIASATTTVALKLALRSLGCMKMTGPAVVARLREQGFRLLEVRLLEARRAGRRLQRSQEAVKAEAAADAKKRDDKLI